MVEWYHSNQPVAYLEAVQIMESHVVSMQHGLADECIWLLEHPALITAGARARAHDLLEPTRFPVFETRRGGQFTYHGPGQRIGYVMLDLNQRGRDVRLFVHRLEEWLICAFAIFNLKVERREGRIGLWVTDRYNGREEKISAVGLRIRKWVSFHGFSVNVEPDLKHFQAIVPCGLSTPEYGVTSMLAQGYPISKADFDAALMQTFDEIMK